MSQSKLPKTVRSERSSELAPLVSLGKRFGERYTQDKTGDFRFAVVFLIVNGILLALITPGLFGHTSDPQSASLLERCLLLLVLFGPLNTIFLYFYFKSRRYISEGVITLPDGTSYAYIAGDTLAWYAKGGRETDGFGAVGSQQAHLQRHFRGMSVHLPVQLPQVYLDTRQDFGRVTPFTIDPSQRVDLEGNFPAQFRMYIPKNAEIEVLSIFQPDVMQTILQFRGDYDIEMYRDTLRIISRRRVYKRSARQAELDKVAAAILQEINRQLKRWQGRKPQSLPSLVVYRYRGFTASGRYLSYRLIVLELVLGLPFLFCIYGAYISVFGDYYDSQGLSVALFFGALFAIAMAAAGIVITRESKIRTQFSQAGKSTKRSKTAK